MFFFLIPGLLTAQWHQQYPSGKGGHLQAVCFPDAKAGWVAGNDGTILKTTDGGTTWLPQEHVANFLLHAINFSGPASESPEFFHYSHYS